MDKSKECGDIHKYMDITHLEIIIGLKTYKEKYKILNTLTLVNENSTKQNMRYSKSSA